MLNWANSNSYNILIGTYTKIKGTLYPKKHGSKKHYQLGYRVIPFCTSLEYIENEMGCEKLAQTLGLRAKPMLKRLDLEETLGWADKMQGVVLSLQILWSCCQLKELKAF